MVSLLLPLAWVFFLVSSYPVAVMTITRVFNIFAISY